MKQIKFTFMLAILMSMVGANRASAHDIAVKNADGVTIYYNYVENVELSVTFRGTSYSQYSNEYTGKVVIPSTVIYDGKTYLVTSIGTSAFRNCSDLTSVEIPNSVAKIGYYAFEDCIGLTTVTIPNSVKDTSFSESYYAFSGCTGLTSINVNCELISYRAFQGCTNLASIIIGSDVKWIRNQAFKGCTGIKNIYCYATTPPSMNDDSFDTYSDIKVIVPFKFIGQYQTDEKWGKFSIEPFRISFSYSVAELSKMKTDIYPENYNIDVTADEGWKLTALTVNGIDMLSSVSEGILPVCIEEDTEVNVTFGWADEANLYTEDAITGIATIEGEGVQVQAKDGQIWIDGAAGKSVRLYTVGGALMTTITPNTGMTGKFSVNAGTYIVQVGNKAAKVVVK